MNKFNRNILYFLVFILMFLSPKAFATLYGKAMDVDSITDQVIESEIRKGDVVSTSESFKNAVSGEKDKQDPDSFVIYNLKDPRLVNKGEPKLILQDRYLEKGKRFGTRLFERLDVGLFSGYHKIVPRGNIRVKEGSPIGLSIKYNFDRLHAVRVNYSYTSFEIEQTKNEFKHNEIGADFVYNLSSLLYGHNRGRLLNFSPVIGASYIFVSNNKISRGALKAQLGLNIDFRLTSSAHLFAEPYFAVVSDQVDLSAGSNPHRWDMMYGVRGGLIVRFNSESDSISRSNYNRNVFLEFAQGTTFFSANSLSLIQSSGRSYRLSVGKWFDPLMGLRLSGVVSYFNHAITSTPARKYMGVIVTPAYEHYARAAMFGGRLDLMLNVLNFFNGYRSKFYQPFSWILTAGVEYGYMLKMIPKSSVHLKTYYAGAVFGTQLAFNPDRFMSLYLEPSILLANYSVPYANAPEHKAKFTDKVFSLNLGVRVSRPEARERHEYNYEFQSRNFAGVMLGMIRNQHGNSFRGDGGFQWNAGVQVGREFLPCVAAKLQVDFQKVYNSDFMRYRVADGTIYKRSALFNEDVTLVNAKVLYMLNVTNLYQGYKAERRVNFFLEVGPSYIGVLKRKLSLYSGEIAGGENPTPILSDDDSGVNGVFALYGGGILDVKVSNRVHVMFEAAGQLLTKSRVFRPHYPNGYYDILMNTNLGVTYDF